MDCGTIGPLSDDKRRRDILAAALCYGGFGDVDPQRVPQTRSDSLSPLLRRGEGGGEGHADRVGHRPSPQPSPRKNGEKEQTEFAALLITYDRNTL